jgi:hypothetical protein
MYLLVVLQIFMATIDDEIVERTRSRVYVSVTLGTIGAE